MQLISKHPAAFLITCYIAGSILHYVLPVHQLIDWLM